MKGSRLLIGALCTCIFGSALADVGVEGKVIYRWENQGLVYYSHIKPNNVDNFIKLDSKGRKIQDFSEDFDEIVEIVVRPKKKEKTGEEITSEDGVAGAKAIEEEVSADRDAKMREKACQIAKSNLSTLESGEAYAPDEKGNMIRMTPEELEEKNMQVKKDIDYFCGDY